MAALCPKCKCENYKYEKPNFRCISCGLLVDVVARPVQEIIKLTDWKNEEEEIWPKKKASK